ncbi:hypothetical protein B0H11DRAFT_512547 [Mycena galericulata]|nr:hypothetical protein B0H11DRAFT_512547 [Mycena galericulata]
MKHKDGHSGSVPHHTCVVHGAFKKERERLCFRKLLAAPCLSPVVDWASLGMSFRIFMLLGLVLFLANLNPTQGRETNASRMRRGLPPLPPRFALRDKRVTASATASARPSPTPRSQLSGRIQVFAGNGSSLGYIKNSASIYGINPDGGSGDLRVRAASGGEEFDMTIANPAPSELPYLGALASSNLALRDLPKVTLSNVDQAPSKSRTRSTDQAIGQSTIWSINPSTKELQARYMNPDGTKSPLSVVFDAADNELFFVGDVDAYNSAYVDFPVVAVELHLSEN